MIHGFLHEEQQAIPEWGSISINEVVLIETTNPNINSIDILTALPTAPNTITSTNPKGISFTFDISEHPNSNVFLLRKAGTLQQVDQGGVFWKLPLTYSVFSYWESISPGFTGNSSSGGGNSNPKQRKDQRETLSPLDRPYVWNSSTSVVQKETFMKADGSGPIRHTNGLPLTNPYKYQEIHEIHNFSYNIDYSSFNYSFYDGYVGKVNESNTLGRAIGKIKFVSFSCSEEYESVGTGVAKTEYHYVRLNLSFEYNPTGWDEDAKLVSMSTLQLTQLIVSPFTVFYDRIRSSATEYAKDPWPLTAGGAAIPYNDNDPADYGYVDHGYPELADLTVVTGVKSLVIP